MSARATKCCCLSMCVGVRACVSGCVCVCCRRLQASVFSRPHHQLKADQPPAPIRLGVETTLSEKKTPGIVLLKQIRAP